MTPDDEFEAYLVTYARELQSRLFDSYDRCGPCGHPWHGLPCVHSIPALGGTTASCMCPGGAS